jgi:hypothetical protein
VLELETKGARGGPRRRAVRSDDLHRRRPRSTSSSDGCASARPSRAARSTSGCSSPGSRCRKADDFDYVVLNDDSSARHRARRHRRRRRLRRR